jgi:hypothetical protein
MKKSKTNIYSAYKIACLVSFLLSAVFYVLAYTQLVYFLIPAGLLGFTGVVFLGFSLNEKK